MNQARKDIVRPGAASAPRILIVEDESDLALLLSYNLELEGYVVENVARGDEAELRLAENAPDLVILDWMLPAVSGLEICRRLRAREATRTLPVIMVTARGEEAERVRGLSVGADDYVVKPFSVPELMARVRALLETQPAGADRRTPLCRRPRPGSGDPPCPPWSARHPPRPDRVPAARISARKAWPGVLARAIARWRMGAGGGDRRAHRRRSRRTPAQGLVAGPRARPDPHGARDRLRLRRDLRQAVSALFRTPSDDAPDSLGSTISINQEIFIFQSGATLGRTAKIRRSSLATNLGLPTLSAAMWPTPLSSTRSACGNSRCNASSAIGR